MRVIQRLNVHQASTHLLVRQATQATFRALISERPAIMRVHQGEKRIVRMNEVIGIGPGCLAVIPAGVSLTIENIPSGSGPYLASALVLGTQMLPLGNPRRLAVGDRALFAFERAAAACEDPLVPTEVREHMVSEVLLWLKEEGVGASSVQSQSIAPRVRALLADDLAAEWTAEKVASALAMSEATLRRRLAKERNVFSDLLVDMRMARALARLQTTTLPVAHIALEVGYDSASRFAARFRARFGISPSEVRERNDRIGTKNDRVSATPRLSNL